MQNFTTQQLLDAIRGATSLGDLTRLVGPTEEENQQAIARLASIEAIDNKWPDWANSPDARDDRERRDRLMEEQRHYELKYF